MPLPEQIAIIENLIAKAKLASIGEVQTAMIESVQVQVWKEGGKDIRIKYVTQC